MAGSINKVTLLGNIGSDPQVRDRWWTENCKFLAGRWKDRQTGEQKEQTEWHRVVIF